MASPISTTVHYLAEDTKNASLRKALTATKSIYAPDAEPDMPRAFKFGSPNGSWAKSSNSRSQSVASPTWPHSPSCVIPWHLHDSRHTHTTSPSFLSGQPFTSMYDTFDLGDWEACTTDISPDLTPVSPACEPSPKRRSKPKHRTEGFSPEPQALKHLIEDVPQAVSEVSKESARKASSKDPAQRMHSKQLLPAPQVVTEEPRAELSKYPSQKPIAYAAVDNKLNTGTSSHNPSPGTTHGRCGSSSLRRCSRGNSCGAPVVMPQRRDGSSSLQRRSHGTPVDTPQRRDGSSTLRRRSHGTPVDIPQRRDGSARPHLEGASPPRPHHKVTVLHCSNDTAPSASDARNTPKPLAVKSIAAPRNMIMSSPESSPLSNPGTLSTPFRTQGKGGRPPQGPPPTKEDVLTVTHSQCASPKHAGEGKPRRRPPPTEAEALFMMRMHTHRKSTRFAQMQPHRHPQRALVTLDSMGSTASELPNGCALRARTETSTSSKSATKHKQKQRAYTATFVPPTALGANSKHTSEAKPQVKRVSFKLHGTEMRGRSCSPAAGRRRPPSRRESCSSSAGSSVGGASAPLMRGVPHEGGPFRQQEVSRWVEEVGKLNVRWGSGPSSTERRIGISSFCESVTSLQLPNGIGATLKGEGVGEVGGMHASGAVSDRSGKLNGGCCGFKWRSTFESAKTAVQVHDAVARCAVRQSTDARGGTKRGSPPKPPHAAPPGGNPGVMNETLAAGNNTTANYDCLQNMFGSLYSCLMELQGSGAAQDGKLHMHEVDACSKMWRRGALRRPGEPADAADIFTNADESCSMSTYMS